MVTGMTDPTERGPGESALLGSSGKKFSAETLRKGFVSGDGGGVGGSSGVWTKGVESTTKRLTGESRDSRTTPTLGAE